MSWNETIDNYLYDGERKVNTLLQSALERLRYSDEILDIYKYLHR